MPTDALPLSLARDSVPKPRPYSRPFLPALLYHSTVRHNRESAAARLGPPLFQTRARPKPSDIVQKEALMSEKEFVLSANGQRRTIFKPKPNRTLMRREGLLCCLSATFLESVRRLRAERLMTKYWRGGRRSKSTASFEGLCRRAVSTCPTRPMRPALPLARPQSPQNFPVSCRQPAAVNLACPQLPIWGGGTPPPRIHTLSILLPKKGAK